MKRLRVFNITLTVLLSLWFILVGMFHFGSSYLRLFESLGDLGRSINYFFSMIFRLKTDVIPTVNDYSKILKWDIFLPEDFEAFKLQASSYFTLLISKENLAAYGSFIANILLNLVKIISIGLPIILALIMLIKRL